MTALAVVFVLGWALSPWLVLGAGLHRGYTPLRSWLASLLPCCLGLLLVPKH